MSHLLKINNNIFYKEAVSEFAHCFSGDILINIHMLLKAGKLGSGDVLLGISSSPSSMSAIIFRLVN